MLRPICSLALLPILFGVAACSDEPASAVDAQANVDSGADAGRDVGTDAGRDVGTDAGADSGTDSGVDASTDAGQDDATVVTSTIAFYDYTIAVDVTPDGRTAAFESFAGLEARLIFVDTITLVATDVGLVGDPGRDLATGIAATRRVSALHNDPVQAGIFDEATGWRDLGSPFATGCGEDISAAFDVSADGLKVVGMAWAGCVPRAMLWTDTGTGAAVRLQRLGSSMLGAAPSNRATVISDDGQVIGGFAELDLVDRSPAIWHADGSGTLINPIADTPGEIVAISADGSVAAGIMGYDAFVWTTTGTTTLVRFGLALPSDPVFPNAINGDGSEVFGGVGDAFSGIPIAFKWTRADGMVPLSDVAAAAGVVIPSGYILNSVLGASADGKVLIGTAFDNQFALKTFVLRFPQ